MNTFSKKKSWVFTLSLILLTAAGVTALILFAPVLVATTIGLVVFIAGITLTAITGILSLVFLKELLKPKKLSTPSPPKKLYNPKEKIFKPLIKYCVYKINNLQYTEDKEEYTNDKKNLEKMLNSKMPIKVIEAPYEIKGAGNKKTVTKTFSIPLSNFEDQASFVMLLKSVFIAMGKKKSMKDFSSIDIHKEFISEKEDEEEEDEINEDDEAEETLTFTIPESIFDKIEEYIENLEASKPYSFQEVRNRRSDSMKENILNKQPRLKKEDNKHQKGNEPPKGNTRPTIF